jgi:hypothetical protein
MSLKQEQKKCNCKNPTKNVADITIKIKERIRARKKELTNAVTQYCADCINCPASGSAWFICKDNTCGSPCTCFSSGGMCPGGGATNAISCT